MVGNVQFHDIAAQFVQLGRFGMDNHALFNRRCARGRVTAASFNLYEAQTTGAKGFQTVGCAKLGNIDTHFGRRAHHGSAGGDLKIVVIDRDIDHFGIDPCRGAEISFTFGDSF